ncbi:hypothetical protein [Haloferula sp. BvORR071]|uniref:hypothetical protein n=1 Tax=Haloferula sp. BvORR071 TaxID=1396141 RepID=UPI00055117EF|nr:hypothetical protein [Haloferula sp. BvORR071]
MKARTCLLLVASHLIVAGLAGLLSWQPDTPSATVAPAEELAPPVARTEARELKEDRPLAQWRSNEFASAWKAMPTAQLASKDRVLAQRELLALWAKVDLEAAIRAALAESLAADGQWFKEVYVNEDMGPLLDALGPALVENPEASWDLIQRGNFGIEAGLLRRLWIVEVAAKNAGLVADKLGEFSARDRDQAILSCGVSLMNQNSNLNYGSFLQMLKALPPDQVSAEQLFQYGTFQGYRPTDDVPVKQALLRTDLNDTRMLRYWAMLLARPLYARSPEQVADVIEGLPEVARVQTLLSTMAGSKPGSSRATGIIDLMIQHGDWASLADPNVTSKLKGGATSEEVANTAFWATSLPVRQETEALFDCGVESYLKDYPDVAVEWIASISQETWRERAYARYIDAALDQHGKADVARQALGKMQDGPLKEEAARRLVAWEANAKAIR